MAALCPASVSETTFPFENLGMVSVFDFFTKYRKPRIPLKHPNGPCLELKGRNMPKVPAEVSNAALPFSIRPSIFAQLCSSIDLLHESRPEFQQEVKC